MDQVGLARMVIAHLEIRPSGIRPSVSKPNRSMGGGGGGGTLLTEVTSFLPKYQAFKNVGGIVPPPLINP